MVKAEGMPQYRNPFEKGDLYVKFDVQFPENNWIDAEKLNVSSPKDMFAEVELNTKALHTRACVINEFLIISGRSSSVCCLLVRRIPRSQQMRKKWN